MQILPHQSSEIFEFYLHAFEFGKLNIGRIKVRGTVHKKQVHGINLNPIYDACHISPSSTTLLASFLVVGNDGSASKSGS